MTVMLFVNKRVALIGCALILLAAASTLVTAQPQPTPTPTATESAPDEAPLDLDTLIVSYNRSFTISYPSDRLDATTVERSPNNVTMTNNWNIFGETGIQLRDADVLVAVDYYPDIQTMSQTLGSPQFTLEAVAQAVYNASPDPKTPLVPMTIGEYSGFSFDTQQEDALFFRYVYLQVADGQYASFLFMTATQAQRDRLTPMFDAIMASFRLGIVLERVAPKDLVLSETYTREDGFTLPYPAGWRVEVAPVGESEFVVITKGQPFDLMSPPYAGEPSALIAYGTLADAGIVADADPLVNAKALVQAITGAPLAEISAAQIKGYPSALAYSFQPLFTNTFAAIMRDETHFIAANIYTAPDADLDFGGIIIEMLTLAELPHPIG